MPQDSFSAEQIVDHYWHEAKHPAWLTLKIVSLEDQKCNILIESDGRLDNDEYMMMIAAIKQNPHPPFSYTITLPPFAQNVGNGAIQTSREQFSLHWREHYRLSFWFRLKSRILFSRLYARYFRWRYGMK